MPIIIGISGKKQSGKSSLAEYLQYWIELQRRNLDYNIEQEFCQENSSIKVCTNDENKFTIMSNRVFYGKNKTIIGDGEKSIVKIYNFAQPLKEICINILGMTRYQTNGTDEQKNAITQYRWENFPKCIQHTFSKYNGFITSREVMQIIGTDIMRKMFDDRVWVNAIFRQINHDNPYVAIISDARFPSEINAIMENNGYIIRLERDIFSSSDLHDSEISLNNFNFKEVCKDRVKIINNNNIIKVDVGEIEYKNTASAYWIGEILLKAGILRKKDSINV